MKIPLLYGSPDLMYNWNNGVVFVVPLTLGRLAQYVRNTEAGLAGWLFSDDDDHPNVGSANDGLRFVEECTAGGLVVSESGNLSVPFSNGPRRRGEYAGQYAPDEYLRVLPTLPTL